MTEKMNAVVPQNNLSVFFCIQEEQYKEPDLLVMAIGLSSPEIKWECRDILETDSDPLIRVVIFLPGDLGDSMVLLSAKPIGNRS